MGIEAILGAAAFGGLFTMFVVLPSRFRRSKSDEQGKLEKITPEGYN